MEIRVLRYFLETAREGNMTRAAQRLHISQPTMSKQLKELEEELGVKLFTRSNYSIRLTEAGMLLRERAEDIVSLADKTFEEFRALDEIGKGDFYVGAAESDAVRYFTETVHKLQQKHPGIRCNIYSGNMEDVCEKLDKGVLDFAIIMSYVDLAKYNYLRSDRPSAFVLQAVARSGFPSVVRTGNRRCQYCGDLEPDLQCFRHGEDRYGVRHNLR